MNDSTTPPIQLDSISKCYRIYKNPQDRFRQALLDRFRTAIGTTHDSPLYREHWALRDVSFELRPGEAVGILGRNGSGKSTLLQIIAGTLAPTSGTVVTNGRITALLELGSGFNPDFTGRENVYLNAQILGLSREEAHARFDGIAAFADIGDFIEQPVKTYSSGMMMRLAFAVQTAVDPKVLIVDEALSVGDMLFQAKCMARINQLVNNGVTLLFVSHDVGVVRQICSRSIFLEHGKLIRIGHTREVADEYVRIQLEDRNRATTRKKELTVELDSGESLTSLGRKSIEEHTGTPAESPLAQKDSSVHQAKKDSDLLLGVDSFLQRAIENRTGTQSASITNVQMLRRGLNSNYFDFGDSVEIRVLATFKDSLENLNLAVKIRTLQGTDVVFMDTRIQDKMGLKYIKDRTYLFSWNVHLPLMHGNYTLSIGLAHPPKEPGEDWVFVDVIPFAYDFKMGTRPGGMIGGYVALPAKLEVACISEMDRVAT